MAGTFNLLQLLQAPSTKLFLKSSNLPKDPFVVMDTRVSSTLSFRRQIQASAYEVVNKSYIFSTGGGAEITTGDKPLGKIETVGAFQKLPMVMPSTDILYSALRKTRRISPTKGISNIAKRVRNQGAKQLDTLMKELAVPLRGYKENFPNKNYLHPYERSLIELTLGEGSYEEVLKWGACLEKDASNYVYSSFQKCDKRISQIRCVVLGKVDALRKRIVSLGKEHASLCAKSLSKREAEERLNEGLKKLKAMFQLQGTCVDDLLNIAKTLRAMPVVNPETPTLCLVGAPNVGKSSLVRILSSGKPEICNYPFTTRGILMGHIAINYKRFQVTDTPGLLKRCDDDRNNLEKLTLAVLSHLPTAVLYVHDLSGECGTSPSDQLIIYKEIRERFKDHLWLDVVSKCDLLQSSPTILVEDEDVEVKRYKKSGPEGAIHVSVTSEIGIIELKARVHNLLESQMARLSSENNEES